VSARAAVCAAVTAMLVTGCASLDPQAPTLVSGAAGGPVRLYQGDTLVVALPSNTVEGARWQPRAADAAVLEPIGTGDLLPPQVAPGLAGAPNDAVYRFRAASAGSTTLELAYRRLGDGASVADRDVRYDITVLARPGDYAEAWAKSR